MKKKIALILSVIPIILIAFYLAKCYEYSRIVSYYPQIEIKTVAPEKERLVSAEVNGCIYHYLNAGKSRGFVKETDGEAELLFKTGKVLSVASAGDIIAVMTKNNIYFYDCKNENLAVMNDEDKTNLLGAVSQPSFQQENFLFAESNRIMFSFSFEHGSKRSNICIYPEMNIQDIYNKVEQVSNKEIVDGLCVNDGGYKEYSDGTVYIKTNEVNGAKLINNVKNELYIRNTTDDSESCIYKTGKNQQIVYADCKKYIILDYNEKAYFLRYVGAEESVFLKNCNLKHFDSYTFERPGNDTILVFDKYYRIVDTIDTNIILQK